MFYDVYSIMRSLDPDTEVENGERVHSFKCRRCTMQWQLGTFRVQLRTIIQNIDEGVGDEMEKPR